MNEEFKIGDLIIVTSMIEDNYDEEYFDRGSWGQITRLDHSKFLVDFSNKGIYEWGDCVFWVEPSQVKHYTLIEDLPLWKSNHMYLNNEQQQALRKLLHRVQWDEEYAEKICFSGLSDDSIIGAFTWEYMEEGHSYWSDINDQCDNKEIQQPIIPDDVREEIKSLHHYAECSIVEEQPKPDGGSSALATQEGGSHYKKCGIQPVEYIQANGLDYFQGNVVKYVTRHKDKNGVEDIKKAIHYLQLILELQYG